MPCMRILDSMRQAARSRNAFFDWAMAVAAFWTVTGLYADLGWHIRHHVDTFFTLTHAILYSGLLLLFGIVGVAAVRNLVAGARRWDALVPPGYLLSLVGIALFFAGGVADLGKHEAFGIERDFDALLSPSHLLIGFGVMLAACGPLRSALLAPRPRSLAGQLPALISTACVLELLHWATNPFFRSNLQRGLETPLPHELGPDAITLQTLHVYEQGSGLMAFILQSLLMMGAAFYVVRNFRLRPGSLTALFVLGNALIGITNSISWGEAGGVLAASLAAGLLGDAFSANVERLRADRMRFAAFAFSVPALYHAVLLIYTAVFLGGVWWDPSIAAGAVIDSGIFGLFLGFAAFAAAPDAPPDAA